MEEREALVVLNNVPQLGPKRLRALRARFGSFAAVLEADREAIQAVTGVGRRVAQALSHWREIPRWEQDLELIHRHKVDLLCEMDSDFPDALRALPNAPMLLYVLGDRRALKAPSVAIVGTRALSHYGAEQAERFAADLAQAGLNVVSGLARGADTAAHRGALRYGKTVAVLGSGLAKLYPPENRDLAAQITRAGALVSEFPMLTPPDRPLFPQRNRIVAGLAQATMLVEAPLKSGAMQTMDLARTYERLCFALPGRVDMESFEGNFALLKEERAKLIQRPEDLLDALAWKAKAHAAKAPVDSVPMSLEESAVLEALSGEELHIDQLALRTNLPITKITVLIMGLLMKRVIKECPGKIYKKALI